MIATGGGAVTDAESLQLMKERGFLIGLSASPESIMERIAQMQTRPLMNTKDKMKRIKELMSHRSPYYREADTIIDTTAKSVETTIEEILNVLHGEPKS